MTRFHVPLAMGMKQWKWFMVLEIPGLKIIFWIYPFQEWNIRKQKITYLKTDVVSAYHKSWQWCFRVCCVILCKAFEKPRGKKSSQMLPLHHQYYMYMLYENVYNFLSTSQQVPPTCLTCVMCPLSHFGSFTQLWRLTSSQCGTPLFNQQSDTWQLTGGGL